MRALRAAAADESTRAVVLFVDSGGGSALASDLIGREVRLVRAKKPVVAVMGSVAASGGYYVLTHANRVIAAPTTVTGSIGVITGKLVVDELFARWGLSAQQIRRGRYALLLDPATPLGDDERALLRRANAEVYDRFVQRVAEGRNLSADRVLRARRAGASGPAPTRSRWASSTSSAIWRRASASRARSAASVPTRQRGTWRPPTSRSSPPRPTPPPSSSWPRPSSARRAG